MFKPVSLRSLINIRIALSVLVVMLLSGIIAIWLARESIEKEINASFTLASEMLSTSTQQDFVYPLQWRQVLNALEHARHVQVAFIDEQGNETTLIDSRQSGEFEAVPTWFRNLVEADSHSATFSVSLNAGVIQRVRVTTDPSDEIAEAWSETKAYFLSLSGLILLIYIIINIVFHSAFKAVASIMLRLRQVESGNYEASSTHANISEFDAIEKQIDELADVLSKAQQNNQALTRHTMKIQESERQNLSRELHDEMGQSLTAIKAMSVALKQPETDREKIADSIIDICNHLSTVVRSMMRTLHPLSLSELGLGATLNDLVDEWSRRHNAISIELSFDDSIDDLSDDITIHLYRIAQECLTNIVRHAHADKATITVLKSSHAGQPIVSLCVKDNGKGGSTEGHGFGIRSMRERVASLGGQFSYDSTPNEGVTIKATIPLNKVL
jgi:two-component system sensor histidine kinase UhpB